MVNKYSQKDEESFEDWRTRLWKDYGIGMDKIEKTSSD